MQPERQPRYSPSQPKGCGMRGSTTSTHVRFIPWQSPRGPGDEQLELSTFKV